MKQKQTKTLKNNKNKNHNVIIVKIMQFVTNCDNRIRKNSEQIAAGTKQTKNGTTQQIQELAT